MGYNAGTFAADGLGALVFHGVESYARWKNWRLARVEEIRQLMKE